MSKLTNSLKEGTDFSRKISLYVDKSFISPYQLKELRSFHGKRNTDKAINEAICFFVAREMKAGKDLFQQLKYSSDLERVLRTLKYMEEDYNKTKQKFYKVDVLQWHLVFCISNLKQLEYYSENFNRINDIENLLLCIINYNLNLYADLFPEKRTISWR